MSNVVRATLSEQVHQELRARILGGQLPGGHRLLPEELANDLAISQTPVKEALLRLEADGLVVSGLRKGAMVRRFTLKDVEELYEARIFVELASLEVAFARGAVTPALLDELSANLERHAFHLGRDTMADLTTALAFDREFHQRLVEARDNSVIAGWHQRILAQTHTAYVYLVNDTSRVYGEHRDILDALRAGSVAQARDALERHLQRSRQSLLDNVRRALAGAP
ncbi:MAG TPA: GntR family transcriptional regulator [Aliidongia sp.]|nr:GntR family transcriptional regulator [Aliidongia sp.]